MATVPGTSTEPDPGDWLGSGHLTKDCCNCLWSCLWVVYHQCRLLQRHNYRAPLSLVCHLVVADLPRLDQLTWMHVQVSFTSSPRRTSRWDWPAHLDARPGELDQLTWTHVQAVDSATARRYCGGPGRRDVDRNDTCHPLPDKESNLGNVCWSSLWVDTKSTMMILAIVPRCASDHQIVIKFHKLIINYKKN